MTININEVPTSIPTVSGDDLVAQVEAARDQAQTAAANAQASALTCATWAVLSGLTGSTAGVGAEVLDSDGGNHTDPVTGEEGVPNAGRYTWSASPAGWERIGDTGLAGKAGRVEGFRWGNQPFPQVVDLNGAELIGFEEKGPDIGSAILRLSPRVVPNLESLLSGRLMMADDAPFSSHRDINGIEMLGFDDEGKLRCAVSDAVVRQIAASMSRLGLGIIDASQSRDIVIFSDSIGAAGSGFGPNLADIMPDRSVYNEGIGGQRALSIFERQGGIPFYGTFADDQIPASGGVVVTGVYCLSASGNLSVPCTVTATDGSTIPGTLARTAATGVYTFTRSTAGSIVAVDAPALITPTAGAVTWTPMGTMRNAIQIWGAGPNDAGRTSGTGVGGAFSVENIMDYYRQASLWTPTSRNVIYGAIIGPYNKLIADGGGRADDTWIVQMTQLNQAWAALYPHQFVDMMALAHAAGLCDLYTTGGVTYPILKTEFCSDGIHPSDDIGKPFMARAIRAHIQAKGW